jgi:hypothetical protein
MCISLAKYKIKTAFISDRESLFLDQEKLEILRLMCLFQSILNMYELKDYL